MSTIGFGGEHHAATRANVIMSPRDQSKSSGAVLGRARATKQLVSNRILDTKTKVFSEN